eukprot:TRINITY_DN9973_c0_g1_i6.p1 TRINITY_DN9973_c0_g1~~TRINITY_DN9973_c0_g1_i6.p1  ORF type:complete len:334 (+),score=34.17 TRINITY_DN9973_c0_g1_i6:223-1224(+)
MAKPSKRAKREMSSNTIVQSLRNPYLPDLYFVGTPDIDNEIAPVECLALELQDVKKTSTILKWASSCLAISVLDGDASIFHFKRRRLLSELLPSRLPWCRRVKRHNGKQLILLNPRAQCASVDLDKDVAECLPELMPSWPCELTTSIASLHVVYAPSRAPSTKSQHQACNDIWPSTFHQNKDLSAAMDLRQFSLEDCQFLAETMAALEKRGRAAAAVRLTRRETIATAVDNRTEHPLQHEAMELIAEVARQQHARNQGACTEDYLLTNMDVVLTHEPCPMSAMALLHSRVARVFFQHTTPTGAYKTSLHIHQQPHLNHRYWCYGGLVSHTVDK